MICLLWAAVVGLAFVAGRIVVWANVNANIVNGNFAAQERLNAQIKEKLRLVGQHID